MYPNPSSVRIIPFFLAFLLVGPLQAQAPKRLTSGEIHAGIQKLQVLGSALYIAAHPDDENTRLIAYLANVEKVETAYLSLTRGDGGQNLIASDIRELLGLTRTQELLAARRIDGGKQFFSRANDFGYSKHPDETFNIWDREQVLADAVWVIRKWRPDVIVLRFDPRAPGTTHGHHTASAVIGMEAFDLAGDPTAFPEQLAYVEPWQPRRIYWNAYTWRGVPEHMRQDKVIKVDANEYLPKLGESVSEIAARSRSQHKSQGFGSAGSRGENIEQLELLKGDDTDAAGDPFANIDLSWNRVEGGVAIATALADIESNFDIDNPSASVPALVSVYQQLRQLPEKEEYWREKKSAEVRELIAASLGLYFGARTDQPMVAPGDSLQISLEVANRSDRSVTLTEYTICAQERSLGEAVKVNDDLISPGVFRQEVGIAIPEDAAYSGPYWLQEPGTLGMYRVDEQSKIGDGESSDPLTVLFGLTLYDQAGNPVSIAYERPVRHGFTDPVKGEQVQPLDITPPVFVELDESSYLFTDATGRDVRVKVTAASPNTSGTVELQSPEGWAVSPAAYDFSIPKIGQEEYFSFRLTPPTGAASAAIVPIARLNTKKETIYNRKLVRIDHDHLPVQLADLDATVPVVKLDLKTAGQNIGYLPGAGDAIPEALTNIGYSVTTLEDGDITSGDLNRFDAIVVGIRAYNVQDRMPNYQPKLLEYVENGGTLVVQYNTSRRLKVEPSEIGPYPFELSRDRVTVEEAPVKILAPDHPVLNYPNKITTADFAGWVQERGLYFPNKWDDRYTPILSSHDPDEPAREGGLLVAEYGAGHFVYTGYSFFRELPAGVPGAYRLFANLVGLGNEME